ncbi:uncharacterized protein LOC123520053 [Portunus trituberculatus]|uniref:uncharacterized protein LOC123520053 n=1 Tax=Portunus trituberculatus TaxID=210409 RepID=UPI001E1CD9CB|nr:uncharacterized protein LOC123520053 [Portunus trituberculatus]
MGSSDSQPIPIPCPCSCRCPSPSCATRLLPRLTGGCTVPGACHPVPEPRPRYTPQPIYENEPALYTFQWEVNDDYYGNYYGHQEHREGPITRGSYYTRLPDTRLMKVEYYVDEYGYHPTITYEGEAQYPAPQAYQHHNVHPVQGDLYL